MLKEGLEIAKTIASKSPIAVQGSKVNLVYSRDHSVEEGLKFMVTIFGRKILHTFIILRYDLRCLNNYF
jgi:hypothetical protein